MVFTKVCLLLCKSQDMKSDYSYKIVMVGAGNVATHLAQALVRAGHSVAQVWSRTSNSAEALSTIVGAQPVTDIRNINTTADVYIISVSDNALAETARRLCSICDHGIFVHTSGTMSMDLFSAYTGQYGVLYPMQTFSRSKAVDFCRIPCFVEASDDNTLDVIRSIAMSISAKVYDLAEEDRRWLHLAAVFACNFSNCCYTIADAILQKHGLAIDVMLPLIDETARKVHVMPPAMGQTGPAVRGDANVMGEQMSLLSGSAELHDLYCAMSGIIAKFKQNETLI